MLADGLGGDASLSFGGDGGIGRGGNAAFQANGTLTQAATLNIDGDAFVSATGQGGQGGAAFIQTNTPAGRGGDGFGGDFTVNNQADPAFTSGAFLLAGGDNGTISVGGLAQVSASAVGGNGGAGESTLAGGAGGNAVGGLAQAGLALLGQSGALGLGRATFDDVVLTADAFGGEGGLTLDQNTGNGGSGTGGFAAFSVRAGQAAVGALTLGAGGSGGNGAIGGEGTGGAAAVLGSLGGRLNAAQIDAFADGNGGSSFVGAAGNGLGGEAAIEIDGIEVIVSGGVNVIADGRGGFSQGPGPGGTGTGGRAYISGTNPNAPGSMLVSGHTGLRAIGSGGGSSNSIASPAGDGFGGTAYIDALEGSRISLGSAQLVAIGEGGFSDIDQGGDGTGGTVRLRASGIFSRLSIARNVSAATASDSPGEFALLSVDGIGARSQGGSGIGGIGRGGSILVSADLGGEVSLPVDILSDPARAADSLFMFARGRGGNSAVDGGTGGEAFGGAITLLADSGTLTAGATTLVSFAQGGSSTLSTSNITGGNATGGSNTIRVINTGTLNLEISDVPILFAARGGDGSGTGDGGSATAGSALFEITDAIANLIGLINLTSAAQGGEGRIGGAALAGTGTTAFRALNASLNFQTNANLQLGLKLDASATGGRGDLQGGSATGGNVDISIRGTSFLNGALSASSSAIGGDASLSNGTGGDAQAGNIDIFTNPSVLGLADSNVFAANAQGGNAGIGGNATSGNITAEFNDTEITVSSLLGSVPELRFLSVATAGQGETDGVNMGDATAGTVSVQLNDSSILTATLELRANALAQSANPEIGGGIATAGSNLLQLEGTSSVTVDSLLVDSTATSSIGQRQVQIGVDPQGNPIFGTFFDFSGQTNGGVSRLLLVENGTPQITANAISVIADSFGAGLDFAGRFSIEVLSGQVETLNLIARTTTFSTLLNATTSQVVVRGASLLAQDAFITSAGDLDFVTSDGGIIGGDPTAGASNFLSAEAGGNITVTGEGADRGLIGGGSLLFNAGRSILLDGTLATSGGDISLFGNSSLTAFSSQPVPSVITMSAAALIDAGNGNVSISLFDGGGNPQRETGTITLGNINARNIGVRHFGSTPGSDITVLSSGVLTASGTGRAIDLASLNGEVINLHGDAGLILTGGGHYGIFAESPQGSLIGDPANYLRRYGVPDAAAYDAINLGGANFAAFRVTPVITVTAADFSRFYGDLDPALGAIFDGFLPGDGIGDILGSPDFLVSAGQFSDIGTYLIDIAQGSLFSVQGYQFQFLPGTLTIDPRPITITASNLSRIYGNANPALGFTVGGLGLVNGDQLSGALVTTAGLTSGVGSYGITQGTLTASDNYAVTFVGGQLTVTPRPITITADSFSRIYGNANPALGFTVGGLGLVNGDQLTGALATTAGLTSGVGSYGITQGTLSAGANYTVTYNAGALTVTPRPITITADSFSRIYGNANPALTFSVGGLGLVNGDQLTGALAAAGVTAGVGTSAITLGTLTAGGNYAVTFNAGVLTITPRPLTVAADNLSKSLGLADPQLTFRITAGDLVNGDLLSGSLVRDPGETIASFAIRQGTLTAGANYTLTYVPGTFTINPPPVSPDINNPTSFEPPVVIDDTPPPATGQSDDRFGIDFPEQPEAPLISEDPLLDDPVSSGGDTSVYGDDDEDEDDDEGSAPTGGQ